jgi:hypothetical protein
MSADESPEEQSAREVIVNLLGRCGPMTTVEMRARGNKTPNLSAYVATLTRAGGPLVKLGGHRGATIYGLAGVSTNGPLFGLNERGDLQIGHGVHAQVLNRDKIKLLKIFIDSTEDVWAPEVE